MSIIDTLITDRSTYDVSRARELSEKGFVNMTAAERTEYLSGMKGGYNATDLNRVGEAVQYLHDRLAGYGYACFVSPKTDFTMADLPTSAQFNRYLQDVETIRDALAVVAVETPTTMQNLTHEQANDIETILIAIDAAIDRLSQIFVYSGMAYSGMIWEEFT